MRNSTVCATLTALMLSAGAASAHHAFSRDFDRDKPVTLNGTVTKVQWTAPHVYAFVDVKDDQGKMANWKVEMGSPTALTKAGWTRTKLKVGDMVTLQGWRAKNGTNFANAEEMTMPDGQKLSAVSSNDRAVATSGRNTPKPATDKPSAAKPAPDTSTPATPAKPY
jgi:hypothetical protein